MWQFHFIKYEDTQGTYRDGVRFFLQKYQYDNLDHFSLKLILKNCYEELKSNPMVDLFIRYQLPPFSFNVLF